MIPTVPKAASPLKEIQIRQAKSGFLFDGGGLYLEVTSAGTKRWRFKYRFAGKPRLLSLGNYPTLSLAEAREKRDQLRRILAAGSDPAVVREFERNAKENTFEAVAEEWFAAKMLRMSESHRERVRRRLEADVYPWLGSKPVHEIIPPQALDVVKRIANRGAVETAHRVLGIISQVFRYAVATGRVTSDPCRDLRGALDRKSDPQHFSAITDPDQFGRLLVAIDNYRGGLVVRTALRLAPLLAVRPGELRRMEWEHVNFDTAEWRYEVTKTRMLHIVPLARQAVALLKELHPLTGLGRYVFPNAKTPDGSRPMSENGVLTALRTLGYEKTEMTGHGFRASFRTIGAEVLGFPVEMLEHQLAHNVRDPLGRAYNRTTYLPQRREMMQRWADFCDELRAKAQRDLGAAATK